MPNKATADIKSAAAIHGPRMIEVLADIASDVKNPSAARVAASAALLDRGFGKPAQALQVSGELDLKTIPDADLDARLSALMAKVGKL